MRALESRRVDGAAVTDFESIARDATDELRRQMCRPGPHAMTPERMLECPRCRPVLRFDMAMAEAAIVQKPRPKA